MPVFLKWDFFAAHHDLQPRPVADHRSVSKRPHLDSRVGLPHQIIYCAGLDVAEILLLGVGLSAGGYQLKVVRVELAGSRQIGLDQRLEAGAFRCPDGFNLIVSAQRWSA